MDQGGYEERIRYSTRDQERSPLRVCAHAAPLAGDHTTDLSGTLGDTHLITLRLMLARGKLVKAIHSSEYNTDLERWNRNLNLSTAMCRMRRSA